METKRASSIFESCLASFASVSKINIGDFVLCIPIKAFVDEGTTLIGLPKISCCSSYLSLVLKQLMTYRHGWLLLSRALTGNSLTH